MDGNDIRRFRRELGLTQAVFASRLGVGREHVGRIEIGSDPVSARVRCAVALLRIVRVLDGRETAVAVEVRGIAEEALR